MTVTGLEAGDRFSVYVDSGRELMTVVLMNLNEKQIFQILHLAFKAWNL